jgi:hypothetical protein
MGTDAGRAVTGIQEFCQDPVTASVQDDFGERRQVASKGLFRTRTQRLSPTRRWKLQSLNHGFANGEEMTPSSFTFLPEDSLR